MPRRFRYGAYGYEGVTCVVASGSSTSATASGQTLVVARAIKLLLTKLGRCETSTDRNSQSPQATLADLADLAAEYATPLSRHAPRHRAMHGRSSRDLKVSGADCQPSTRALIARRNGSTSSPWHRPFRQPATSLLSRSAA